MIATMLQLLFPVDDRPARRRGASGFFTYDLPRLTRRLEPLFSHAMVLAAGGLVLMMAARILAAWAQGRL